MLQKETKGKAKADGMGEKPSHLQRAKKSSVHKVKALMNTQNGARDGT